MPIHTIDKTSLEIFDNQCFNFKDHCFNFVQKPTTFCTMTFSNPILVHQESFACIRLGILHPYVYSYIHVYVCRVSLDSVFQESSPLDPHKDFLRVQGQKARVLNPEYFYCISKSRIKIVLMYSVKVISQIISKILLLQYKNSSFLLIHFLFYFEGPRGPTHQVPVSILGV